MPIESFSFKRVISGADLPFLPPPVRGETEITVETTVTLSWGVKTTPGDVSFGRYGDRCFRLQPKNVSIYWRAGVVEVLTKKRSPMKGINALGKIATNVGEVVVAVSAATALYLWWTGVGLEAAGLIAAGGTLIIGAGALVSWLTSPTSQSKTTSKEKTGVYTRSYTLAEETPCEEAADARLLEAAPDEQPEEAVITAGVGHIAEAAAGVEPEPESP